MNVYRMFHRLDRVILEKSTSLELLPDDRDVPVRKRAKKVSSASPSCSEAATTIFRVDTDSE